MLRPRRLHVKEIAPVAALILGALAVRLIFINYFTFEGIGRDTASYFNVATNFAEGRGWVNHSLRFLFLLPETLPQPDSYWSPLFPLMLAGVFKVFGVTFGVAQVVPLVFGVLIPAVVFRLVMALSGSMPVAAGGGILAVFHPALIMWSVRVQPEIISMFFVALALLLLVENGRPWLLGVAIGLAYLCKYQNLLLWAGVLAHLAATADRRLALRRLMTTVAVFLVTVSPWWIRNTIVFGDPMYSAIRHMLLSYYPELGGEARMSASLTPPPGTLPYLLSHPAALLAHTKNGLHVLANDFLRSYAGGLWLIVLSAIGLPAIGSRWRIWVGPMAFSAVVVLTFAATVPIARYIMVLIPVWIALGATGTRVFFDGRQYYPRARFVAGVATIGMCAYSGLAEVHATVSNSSAVWTPSANFGVLEAQAVAPFVKQHTTEGEPVFVGEPYHYALILDRPAVQIPYNEESLREIRRRYGIRYLVVSKRDWAKRFPRWVDSPPPWAHLVRTIPPNEIPRPPGQPNYPYVDEMRIYRFADARTGVSPD